MKESIDASHTAVSSVLAPEYRADLAAVFLEHLKKKKPHGYDCVIHNDGSPSAVYQLAVLKKVYNLRPLAVTFNHNGYSAEECFRREWALEAFDADAIVFNARKSVLQKFKDIELEKMRHRGMVAFLLRIAEYYEIPLVILDARLLPPSVDQPMFGLGGVVYESLEKGPFPTPTTPNSVSSFDLTPYRFPSREVLEARGVYAVVLSHFLRTDSGLQHETLARHFEMKSDEEIAMTLQKQREEEEKRRTPWHTRAPDAPTRESTVSRKWRDMAEASPFGRPLFDSVLRYCSRCCLPETAEELAFDELGICQACRSSEQKMHINWLDRQEMLKNLLERYRDANDYYDCLIPISGGKDSTFQVYCVTQVYKMRPLGVTFSHNWYSETGKDNLRNAYERFDIDHIMFIPRRRIVNKLARKSLGMIGDSCWHCHAGVGSFPLQVAVKFRIRLLIWGESTAENADGRATYEEPMEFDRDYFTKVSARFFAEEMADDDLSLADLDPYVLPTYEEFERNRTLGIHLGDYMFWDDERQMEFIRDNYGWKEEKVEGTYKGYKSVECRMAGVHDYTKFLKRGFGRGTDHATQDVRHGLLTREEGFELAKKYDTERPEALDYYLEITGFTEDEVEKILKGKRDEKSGKLP